MNKFYFNYERFVIFSISYLFINGTNITLLVQNKSVIIMYIQLI